MAKKNKPDSVKQQNSGVGGAVTLSEDDLPLMADFITEAKEHIENSEAGLLEMESGKACEEAIDQVFRGFHTIKGMAGFLNLKMIGELGHSAENLLDMGRKGEIELEGENVNAIFETIDMLKAMVDELNKAINSDNTIYEPKGFKELVGRLDGITDKAFFEPAEKETPEVISDKNESSEQVIEDVEESIESLVVDKAVKTSVNDEKIKVRTERLDNLIDMVGELVIAHSMVEQHAKDINALGEQEFSEKVGHQGKIVRDLQELSMLLRMVPIRGVFQRMNRLVRDLSVKSGKNVELVINGEDTELDRNLVDMVSDPLVHMIRNSIDHGIESEKERKAAGKDAAGRIELSAFHQGGNIIIKLADDGKGLDKERILKKAVERGVVNENCELSDDEIYKLIFAPGFSTASVVTEISGRGVGMDVVKKNIESLRGKISIESEQGKGAVFTISLPMTMAVIDGQIVRIGKECYIIPIVSIVSCMRPKANEVVTVQGRGEVVKLQDELVPVVRLYKQFKVSPDSEDITQSAVVIVELGSRKCGLIVDELLGQQQVVIKGLGKSLGEVSGVSGGAIMGDGRVSLILDVSEIVNNSV